ncbi:MAG: 1-(5-phosphoribosyl)-5-[(5-phosphoribosylamino)methylideneamino]imidazole-4-carboxamide isomerase [Kiritimatiellae bacterium]|jgi:phosphoribosylformimino-5-aminoimidazole carboxamide ribotide isomerase|nr:1-(5-phosphoribosyl)-5-[(5-phosphoribosylamino)methylideneamino]imidazole-4-carboxamide isomerase [Kiritimatiellia bacterium]
MIKIIPAIDLKGGKCVRLRQGKADDSKIYGDDPVVQAKIWEDQGAELIHVVDLDGAFNGKPAHLDVIKQITSAISIPIEVGGGLRTDKDIEAVLNAGAQMAIIGTRAFSDPKSLANVIDTFGEHIEVGIDARDGMVQVNGWVETTSIKAVDLARQVDELGVSTIIFTDTATDGMMKGTNVPAMNEICECVRCNVVASGGISTVADIISLKNLHKQNLVGAIVGKALYEGTISIEQLLQVQK